MKAIMRFSAMLLLFTFVFSMQAFPGTAVMDEPIVAKTLNELKLALENPTGGHVRLGANITIPSSFKQDAALIEIPAGSSHVLDLNGFAFTYFFLNRANEYDGVPLRVNGNLTINGPGSITGGYVAVENAGWDTTLILNGGDFTGKAASGIRSGGLTILNGGTLTGRFGDVWHERGLLVDTAGMVQKIDSTFAQNTSTIRNGILSGKAELSGRLTIPNLQIPEAASLTIMERGILDVTGTLTGESRILMDGGLLIKNGAVTIDGPHQVRSSLSVRTATITPTGEANLMDGVTFTIRENLVNNGTLRVGKGALLSIGGDLVNNGTIMHEDSNGVSIAGDISGTGTMDRPGMPSGSSEDGVLMEGTVPEHMQNAANTLYTLGLFKGTGTRTDGTPIYDLLAQPSRQVAITMLIRLLGKEQDALNGSWKHPFTDVDAWATPYVGYAYVNGLTTGISSTLFGGIDPATPTQYLTFLLRALGYSDKEGDFAWDRPNLLAESIGMGVGSYFQGATVFFRGDVVVLSEMTLYQHLKGTEQRLVDALVERGAVTREAADQAGFIQAAP